MRNRLMINGAGLATVCITLLAATLSARAAESVPTADAGTVTVRADGADVRRGELRMRVDALADDLLRVRVAPSGTFAEDASWVVDAATRAGRASVQPWSEGTASGFRTHSLIVRIERAPLRLVVTDTSGKVLSADAPDGGLDTRGSAFTVRKQFGVSEHVFGLGDKTGPLDRRGGTFVGWNTDAFAYQESTDPIYKTIPFFVVTGGAAGSYGILLDNTWRTSFDFGHVDPDTLTFGALAGPIDYYLLYGPSFRRVVERYADLSGHAPLAPLWSLGFQQSRYSYMSATEVRSIAARLRSERLPADVIWMDIDYQDHNRPFTTNKQTFPDLPGLVLDMRQQGIRLVAITDLHIASLPDQGYGPYDTGLAGKHFVRNADGSVYVAPVWPGPSVFPDFTDSGARAYWGDLYREFIAAGISGFWNDMNEPAIFETRTKTMPLDVQHHIGEPGFAARDATHAEIHNIYGMENTRATFEGMLKFAPDERPLVMTRASFAGGQRYAVTWTGDNSATWNHLRLSIPMLLNLGLSGFGYSAVDVGGYAGLPNPELMTRWMEVAAFIPIFRAHSEKSAFRKEPWIDGPRHTAIRRRFIEERYRLLPYLYALADENARTGAPLMRPVFYDYPDALDGNCDQSSTFLFGSRLLVAPPPNFESSAPYDICLPSGRWYDYWSGTEVKGRPQPKNSYTSIQTGGTIINSKPTLASLPVYVRAGSIIPHQPLVQSTEQTPQGALFLDVYPGADCAGALYLDDGHSLAYSRGVYLRQKLSCREDADGLTIAFEAREGSFQPWWKTLQIRVHGWQGAAQATVNDRAVAATWVPAVTGQAPALQVSLADQAGVAELRIHHQQVSQ